LRDRFFLSPEQRQNESVMRWDVGEVRVQLRSAMKGALSCRPVAFVVKLDRGERVVSFRQCVIEAERFVHRFFGERPMFRWQNRVRGSPRMIKTQPNVSESIRRIERNRLLKIFPHPFVARRIKIPPKMAASEIKLMRFGVFCWLARNGPPLRTTQSGLQGLGDLLRDIAFDGENIDQLAIVSLRLKMRVALGIDELDMDAHPIAGFAHRAFENVCHAELVCDRDNIVG
jgi:hypothetical protein